MSKVYCLHQQNLEECKEKSGGTKKKFEVKKEMQAKETMENDNDDANSLDLDEEDETNPFVLQPPGMENNESDKRSREDNPFLLLAQPSLKNRKRTESSHSRSKTNIPSNVSQLSSNQRNMRTKQKSLTDITKVRPPKGPDLTFLSTCIENKQQLSSGLSNEQMTRLMSIHDEVIEKSVTVWNGFVVEKSTQEQLYDYLIVFGDVHKAVQCAIAIQENLFSASWPSFYFEYEHSQNIQYAGQPANSFNGLRVGVCLHSGRVGKDVNPFDDQKESLIVEEMQVFDVKYSGTCVDLCKKMCGHVCGGEVVCTSATKGALSQTRLSNDNVSSINILGYHFFEPLRTVKLMSFAIRQFPRQFPPKSLNGGRFDAPQVWKGGIIIIII
ncbi:hypothetical protein RFI_10869, partial [Reticulomyxa filosa]